MADNVAISAGSGTAVSTDDIGGVHVQRAKIMLGANNTDDGTVATANPLPISDAGGSLTVDNANLVTLAGAVAGTEVQVDIVGALPAGSAAIGKLAANSGVDIGDVDVLSIAAGANNIGNVGLVGRTTGGLSWFHSIDLDETEEDIKTSAGQVYCIHAINLSTAVRYLRFYNATAANVIVGTTAALCCFPIPTQAATGNGAGFVFPIPQGIAFSTAISAAVTTGIAATDTGAPGTNDVVVNVGYV